MIDVIASEWLKLRSVRSTYYLLAAVAVTFMLGSLVAWLMVADWDASPPQERAVFETADVSLPVMPFAHFCLAALGCLTVTSEYATGMIRTSLVAVPQRRAVLAAKVAVVAAVALAAGQAVAFAAMLASWLIVGDRPPPIAPWSSVSDALPAVLSGGLSVMVVGLVALGLGVVIRSTAGTLVAMSALLFVLPVIARFLPSPWDLRTAAVMLPSLAPQLAGAVPEAPLSPLAALAMMAAYVAASLAVGAAVFSRRDA